MKRVQKRTRHGFDSRRLHQSIFEREFFVGGAMVSIDGLVDKWTTREAMDVIQAKSVNANASTFGVAKVSMGRDFRFGTRTAEAIAA